MCNKWSMILILLLFVHVTIINSARVCEPGKFGWHCKFSCYCAEGSCDPVTGACSSGCKQNRYGPGCQLLSVFRYSVEAHGYLGNTDRTGDAERCVQWNDPIFVKMYGLKPTDFPDKKIPGAVCRNPLNKNLYNLGLTEKGPWCFTNFIEKPKYFGSCDIPLRGCDSGLFGEMCEFECHCKDEKSCGRLGTCSSGCHPGWMNTTCQTRCNAGKFGDGCVSTCGSCKVGPCDFETGECDEGCSSGWKGKLCKTGCSEGEYGENCANVCGACLRDPCDVHTGHCVHGCQDGYKGRLCKTECETGHFGTNCSRTCGHCALGSCHFVTGECSTGCSPGWQGAQCLDPCDDFTFGENCSMKCGACNGMSPCEKEAGKCKDGCEQGYKGNQCLDLVPRELTDDTSVGSAVGGIVAGLVIIAVVVVVVIFIRRRKMQSVLLGKKLKQDAERPTGEFNLSKETDGLIANESSTSDDIDPNLNEPIYANVNTKKQSSPIKLGNLFDYIQDNKKNECEGFKKEFNELPHGLMALCDEAKKPENKPKNRYGNITAYDHSRVVLDPLPNDPSSDYINANYIDGYNRKGAYIASQGPTKVMIRDFWRMIWQKRVCKIVMLTNLMEACKKKCEQYWSEEGTAKYGDITVEMLDTAVFNDFTIRTFKIAANGSSRIVKQFHFTSWSDHGALIYPTPLLTFRRKVRMYSPESTAPIVVHCSAGIGRSGTYIALDYLMDQAKNENIVDVLKCSQLMRANRINMIQTWEQYVFVYETLLEATQAGETTIPYSAFRAQYEELCKQPDNGGPSKMEDQFKVLQKLTTGIDSSQYKEALDAENVSKNRVKNILPAKRCRPNLYTQVEGCNNYINAMFLPGYIHRDSFIVTQMPLPNTVADFWRMLYDYNSHTVVMLNEFDRNDKTCALYWPEEYGYMVEYDPLSIELLSSTEDNNVSIRIFKLSNHIKKEERAIKQFQLKSWTENQIVPNNPDSLMEVMEMVYDWMKQNGKGPITVHCMNGAKKSGLFCGINLMFERMQRDHEVDVFQTLKTIRVNRPQFIEDIEQYQFCYQMAMKYLDYNDL